MTTPRNLFKEYFLVGPEESALEHVLSSGAEWNYSAGVPLSIGQTITSYANPANSFDGAAACTGLAVGWNYADGLLAIATGVTQLLDKENYRQSQNKAKGILNIISGIQLFAFSYNPALTTALGLTGGAALASPSFALAMFCDLINASIDLYNAEVESTFEGWLEERYKELKYNNERIEALEKQITLLSTDAQNNQQFRLFPGKSNAEKISEIRETIARIKKTKIEPIMQQVDTYTRVYLQDAGANKDEYTKSVMAIRARYGIKDTINQLPVTDSDRNDYKAFMYQQEKAVIQARITLALKVASFIGMSLLAVAAFTTCPPVLFVGLAITAVVATAYIIRNSHKIHAGLKGLIGASAEQDSMNKDAICANPDSGMSMMPVFMQFA